MKIKSKNIAKDSPSKKLKKKSQEEIISNLQEEISQLKNHIRVLNNHLIAKDSYLYKKVTSDKEEISQLRNNLKRNPTKPERLKIYKRVVAEIVKCESIEQKPNIQKICDKINGKDSIWDLRPAFDRWKERHPQDYSKIRKELRLSSN